MSQANQLSEAGEAAATAAAENTRTHTHKHTHSRVTMYTANGIRTAAGCE